MASNSNEEEASMTMQQREDWLRERGVEIEPPQTATSESCSSSTTGTMSSILEQMAGVGLKEDEDDVSSNNVSFVCVPQDESKEIFSLKLPASLAKNANGDLLPKYVKPYFASDRQSIDTALLEQQATKHFAGGNLSGLVESNISAASMNAAAAMGSVETFPLVHPADTNGYTGVYIYLDEVGMLKKLPNNNRATRIAATCGFHPPPNFYGDVFIGRVTSRPTLQNVNFEVHDTNRESQWMQRAISENLIWQQELNKVTNKTSEVQPPAVGTEGNTAEENNFSWTQDEEEVELSVLPPMEESSSFNKKLVKVIFLSKKVKVKYDKQDILDVSLYGAIDVDGCTWTIDGSNIVITCEKVDTGTFWPRISP
ncbi:unnamed protein product [Cylindrotheca closterium]|uniref:CS domain-containing protein n=1 Tax=Cylindrotheca closterium TaxID=2856 RepID=A0AAD2FWQ5_9STRA|nr:unnamed protein product [Cylindrotheca closterium]